MRENKYDDIEFFDKYKSMPRSINGLKGAGEWHELKRMLPSMKNKNILDLGCGFGWHCKYASEQEADKIVGIDISKKMLEEAKKRNDSKNIEYLNIPIEDIDFKEGEFDIVISSLALHYIEDCKKVFMKVNTCLSEKGEFIFSVEHPIFTSKGSQDWNYDKDGNILDWPVDRYFTEGLRETKFLGEEVKKYHRTLMTYINELIESGFNIKKVVEPKADPNLLDKYDGMKDEFRRPMFLIISATKNI